MSISLDLSVLPEADQAELLHLVEAKLFTAEKEAQLLHERLAAIKDSIRKYQVFLSYTHKDTSISIPAKTQTITLQEFHLTPTASQEAYNPDGTQAGKILFVLRRPSLYGFETFVGAGSVVQAILQEEPSLRTEGNTALMRKFGPALSRMAAEGEVVRMLEKGSKSRIHYLSPDWFVNDKPKPEYEKTVSNLEPLTVIKSSVVSATADANSDTSEAKLPVDVVKETLPDS